MVCKKKTSRKSHLVFLESYKFWTPKDALRKPSLLVETDGRKGFPEEWGTRVRVLCMFCDFRHKMIWFASVFGEATACDVQNHGPKNGCQDAIGCSQCTNPSFPGRFLKEKNQHTERCSFFRQEKYLQQIQAAILERDAEAQRVVCMRVTGKMARAWGLGADHLFFVYLYNIIIYIYLHDIEITCPPG